MGHVSTLPFRVTGHHVNCNLLIDKLNSYFYFPIGLSPFTGVAHPSTVPKLSVVPLVSHLVYWWWNYQKRWIMIQISCRACAEQDLVLKVQMEIWINKGHKQERFKHVQCYETSSHSSIGSSEQAPKVDPVVVWSSLEVVSMWNASIAQEGVRAGILYMGSKNFIKIAQGTHPPKSGDFSGNSVIKYSFLDVNYRTHHLLLLNPLFVWQSPSQNHPPSTTWRGHYQLGCQHWLFRMGWGWHLSADRICLRQCEPLWATELLPLAMVGQRKSKYCELEDDFLWQHCWCVACWVHVSWGTSTDATLAVNATTIWGCLVQVVSLGVSPLFNWNDVP